MCVNRYNVKVRFTKRVRELVNVCEYEVAVLVCESLFLKYSESVCLYECLLTKIQFVCERDSE